MPFTSPSCADLALPAAERLAGDFARQSYVLCTGVLSPERAAAMRTKALELVEWHARRIAQESAEHVLRYRVVTGEVIRTEWPELVELYQSAKMLAWIAAVAGVPAIFTSSHWQSALNINALGEPGEVYRWHTDAAGFTLLLYLSSSEPDDGGVLELRPPGLNKTVRIVPSAGTIVLMDGTRCLHRASPIVRRHQRISMPMVFTTEPNHQRPQGLDDYLYG